MHPKIKNKTAFSLIELSIVITIIAIMIGGVLGGSSLIHSTKLAKARIATASAPMLGIENMVLWLETTKKESFSNGEDSDGKALTVWNDVNNQIDDVVATAAGGPTYSKDAINGLPAIAFDGATTYFTIPDSDALSPTGDMTLFAVVVINDTSTSNILSKSGNDSYRWVTSASFPHWLLLNDGLSYEVYTGNAIKQFTPIIVSAVIDIGNNITLSENKVNSQIIATTKSSISDNALPLLIGAYTTAPAEVLQGHIGEIIMFDRLLDQREQNDIFDYLSSKWNIDLE